VAGCSAQPSSSDLDRRIERHVRSQFNIPGTVEVRIGPRTPSPEFPEYERLVITFAQGERQQQQEFLLAKDGGTLLRLTKMDIRNDPYLELMKKIDLQGRPVRGAQEAKVTIVNYDDFQCPFCARMYATLVDDILPGYGDRVKLVSKDFPLTEIHPWATRAAVNANCLLEQSQDAYWAFSDYVHANQKEISTGSKDGATAPVAAPGAKSGPEQQLARLDRLALEHGQKYNLQAPRLEACLKAQSDAAVQASMKEGGQLGVQATPTLFINGEKVDGAVPAAQLREILDRALREAGEEPPARTASGSGAQEGAPEGSR
jgi:protein-disulfide isomerase